jgi:dCTP deaminase
MFLNADTIQAEVKSGRLVIEPFLPALLKPASYVLRAGRQSRVWKSTGQVIDLWEENAGGGSLSEISESEDITIQPGAFVLISTLESIALPEDVLAIVTTMSHLARFGISCQLGSGLVTPGFGTACKSPLALELISFNPNPIRLRAGIPLCHLLFTRVEAMDRSALKLGQSVYENRQCPHRPLLYEEFGHILSLLPMKGSNEHS